MPEPPGLILIGRVRRPDALVSAAGSWANLPLPTGSELVRSITDESVASVVDLSQPVDVAVSVGLSRRGIDPLVAFSVAVKSFDDAKGKLGARHRLVAGDNGSFKVEGLGERARPPRGAEDEEEDDDGDADGCVLAPAARGGRLVCGEAAALEALAPYLSRTLPREEWPSDVHLEIRPEPVRAPLMEVRASIPVLARSMLGTQSPAVRDFIDASVGELMDVVNDTRRVSIDATVAESGVVATTRLEFQSSSSTFARMLTARDRAGAAPAAFFHLPSETDTAFFASGGDPKLLERPREIVGNLIAEASEDVGMPEPERKALRELLADRILPLLTDGTRVYGKGFDQAAVVKAIAARKAVKQGDRPAEDEATRQVVEQILGWHLYQVSEPIAKVGPILKDCSALYNRPVVVKQLGPKAVRLRLAPPPPGVALPKGTVHLELTVPRDDLELAPGSAAAAKGANAKGANAKARKVPRKPLVFHLLAVPDGGATWLAFGLDGKLAARKASASLATAKDASTLDKAGPDHEALREGELTGGGIMTVRGLAMAASLADEDDRLLSLLSTLPHKGAAPIVIAGTTEPGSAIASAGVSVSSVHVTRAVIEDVVKLAISSR